MSKLFKLMQTKGEWHKFTSFSLGGGAKLYKNFAQKLLAVSLCMAVVLFGVPRGQNFVAEAADEATKSLVLLTLTLTDDEDEPLKADMTWKKFIPGAEEALELAFRRADGSLVGVLSPNSVNADSRVPAPSWVSAWLSALGVSSLSLHNCSSLGIGSRLLSVSSADLAFGSAGLSPSGIGWVPPVRLYFGYDGFLYVPGLWRSPVGGSLDMSSANLPAANGCTLVSDNPGVVEVLASGDLRAVSAGTATVSWTDSAGLCVLKCAVGDGWVPPYEVPAGLTAVAGTRLGDVALPAPTDAGTWDWVHHDDLLTTPAPTTHKALYTPTDRIQYDPVGVDVPVEVYLEKAVSVKGNTQRLRVYNPNNVLPAGAKFEALAVTEHEHLDDDHEIERLLAYDLSLLDASENPLHMPLDAPVELLFEVPDGLDKDELEVVLVKQFDDREFDEELVVLEGSTWVKVKTDHFSPYALIDRLSAEEKAARNVKTGDASRDVLLLSALTVFVTGLYFALFLKKTRVF